MLKLNTPLKEEEILKLKIGQYVLLTGKIYTLRDQAHKRIFETIKGGEALPFDLKNQVIYYCGPTPHPKGKIIGSCGPTTASRMDKFTNLLLKAGLKGMIGKGRRSEEIIKAIKKYKAVYFLTYAGCGALLSKYVRKKIPIAYLDLGPEAIYQLEVRDFPLIVAVDIEGRDIYGKKRW
ncbi:MAG: FumA C-terminus/TtdB family hydratase beta subunit [Candidatus Omnitrophica bacterium]|nr:FumA C-terminus/TtdB family hydratase beta subunit [Candidatus Omnitrophota bacterium]MCM8799948.1 FumA C-terminus/TtdB family hydratase beta subunit [Candidatus Omnitrophota bacterium]